MIESPGVGLWQWVITSPSGGISLKTDFTVCRYGRLATKPPACPYSACLLDQGCQKCEEWWSADAGEQDKQVLQMNLEL